MQLTSRYERVQRVLSLLSTMVMNTSSGDLLFFALAATTRLSLSTRRCYSQGLRQRAQVRSYPFHARAFPHIMCREGKANHLSKGTRVNLVARTAREEKNDCSRPANRARANLHTPVASHKAKAVPIVRLKYASEAQSLRAMLNIELLHGVELINQTTSNTFNNSSLKTITNQTSYNSNEYKITHAQLKNKIGPF